MIRSALLATFFALALTACGEKPSEEMPVVEEVPAVQEMTEEAPAEEMTEEAPAVEEMTEEVPAVEEVPAAE